MTEASSDAFDLGRFLAAQEGVYPAALAEITAGSKRSHWMWFIFPQVSGLGSSSVAQRYAIRSRAEAQAYLAHAVLGQRLLECTKALLGVHGRSASQIMGSPDDLKLRSSMTLFAYVSKSDSPLEKVLAKFFSGEKDQKTVNFLRIDEPPGA